MSIVQSSQFVSVAASGEDWRDTSKSILEQLEQVKKDNPDFNFGFLYISDHLVDDATSILNIFKSVLSIESWVGCIGIGICANGQAYIDQPAISVMIGHFDEDEFCMFPHKGVHKGLSDDAPDQALSAWLQGHDPMMVFVHGDPVSEEDPALDLQTLEASTGGFLTGGLSSSRHEHAQFANDVLQGCLSGVAFSRNVSVATTLSQGCVPIGEIHSITGSGDHSILQLDDKKASEIFEDDLRAMAIKKIGRDPDKILVDEDTVPEEFQAVFKGEIHAAFPVTGSDQSDYLVRNIMGINPDSGAMDVNHNVMNGESVMFVHRDDHSVQKDLSKQLLALRERVIKDTGRFEPKGGIYVSCVARAFREDKSDGAQREMELVKEIIGDVPLTGFYASGEISKARLYGYTGILILFL